MSFDYTASFEWLDEEFRRETGLMAPGKDCSPGMYSDDDPVAADHRQHAWRRWMDVRSEQAWTLWHEKYGMLAAQQDKGEQS
jgi:hypothetical protein